MKNNKEWENEFEDTRPRVKAFMEELNVLAVKHGVELPDLKIRIIAKRNVDA